jgi:hypothetical protein
MCGKLDRCMQAKVKEDAMEAKENGLRRNTIQTDKPR